MLKVSIEIAAEHSEEVSYVMELIATQVSQGYLSGFDQNDTGSYTYKVEKTQQGD